MRSIKIRLAVYAALAVIAFDVLASISSRATGTPYVQYALGSLFVYLVAGIVVGHRVGVIWATVVGLLMGAVDSTVGWAAAWAIGPGRPEPGVYNSAADVVTAMVTIILMFGAVTLFGGLLGRGTRAVSNKLKRSTPQTQAGQRRSERGAHVLKLTLAAAVASLPSPFGA